MRKLVMTAARNGYFFVLDRVTGEHLLTSKYGSATNWVKDLDEKGRPRRNPEKDPTVGGSIVSPIAGGTVNWEPPAFSPDTGLFYVSENNIYLDLLPDRSPIRAARWASAASSSRGVGIGRQLPDRDRLQDRQGRVAARVPRRGAAAAAACSPPPASSSSPATAAATSSRTMPLTGKPLWHSRIGGVTNPPQTYMLDGRQYLLVATGDTLYAFVMYAGAGGS